MAHDGMIGLQLVPEIQHDWKAVSECRGCVREAATRSTAAQATELTGRGGAEQRSVVTIARRP